MLTQAIPEHLTSRIPEGIRAGDIMARYWYRGETDGSTPAGLFYVVMGELADAEIGYDEKYDALTARLSVAAKVEVETDFFQKGVGRLAPQTIVSHVNPVYDQPVLLRGLVKDPLDAEAQAHSLADNDAFRAADGEWEVAVIGNVALRRLSAALFVAGGNVLGVPRVGEPTAANLRADRAGYIGEKLLDYFMTMPDTPRSE